MLRHYFLLFPFLLLRLFPPFFLPEVAVLLFLPRLVDFLLRDPVFLVVFLLDLDDDLVLFADFLRREDFFLGGTKPINIAAAFFFGGIVKNRIAECDGGYKLPC